MTFEFVDVDLHVRSCTPSASVMSPIFHDAPMGGDFSQPLGAGILGPVRDCHGPPGAQRPGVATASRKSSRIGRRNGRSTLSKSAPGSCATLKTARRANARTWGARDALSQ